MDDRLVYFPIWAMALCVAIVVGVAAIAWYAEDCHRKSGRKDTRPWIGFG